MRWFFVESFLVALALCSLGWPTESRSADQPEAAPRRWAILTSPAARETGIADLVFDRLSEFHEIEWVERDRLDAIADEIRLESLLQNGMSERRRLGRLLNAEYLLVFLHRASDGASDSASDSAAPLEVACIDCRQGVRLTTSYVSADRAQMAASETAVCQAVRDTMKNFSGGVTRIVAVAPLVSQNIVHRHDYLQVGLARLIRTGLLNMPGVAVVELDEARAIQRELSLSDVDAVQRRAPILIEGEYKVTAASGRQADRVAITMRIRRGPQQVDPVRLGPMPLPEASHYLLDEFPQAVLTGIVDQGDDANTPVADASSRHVQLKWFTDQAVRFDELGVWDEAASLREAALLLRPHDAPLRIALLTTYREIFRKRRAERFATWLAVEDVDDFRQILQRSVSAYLAGLGHLEFLIRNERLDAVQAIDWTQRYGTSQLLDWPPLHRADSIDPAFHAARREQLAGVESAKERFLLDVFPGVLRFSSTPPEESLIRARDRVGLTGNNAKAIIAHRWQEICVELMLRRADRDTPNADDFDFIFRMLTTRIPDGLKPTTEMVHFLNARGIRFRFQTPHVPASNQDAWSRFLARLAESDHAMARLYARYALLSPSARAAATLPDQERVRVVARIRELQREYSEALRVAGHPGKATDGWLYAVTEIWLRNIQRAATVQPSPPRRPATDSSQRPLATTGQLGFRQLDLMLIQQDGQRVEFATCGRSVPVPTPRPVADRRSITVGGVRTLRGIVQCGDHLDALWDPWTLYLMNEPGVARTVMQRDALTFRDVLWDGESIWTATEQGEIWRISRAGQVERRISARDGLLPSDRGLSIGSVSPGRLIAAGSFGPHQRGWCAEITAQQGQPPAIRLVHEATRVAPAEASGAQAERFANLCFVPTGMHRFESRDPGGRDVMLVGRKNRRRPLAVDLQTFEVAVFDRRLAEIHRDSLFSRAGNTLQPFMEGVYLNSFPGDGPGQTLTNLCPTRHLVGNLNALRQRVLRYEGWLYVPGEVWYRVHPKSFEAELLTPRRLPSPFVSMHGFDTSACHGILAWNRNHLYQVITP